MADGTTAAAPACPPSATTAPPQQREDGQPSLGAVLGKLLAGELPAEVWDKLLAAAQDRHKAYLRWQTGQPTPNLNKALSLLQGELPKVTKEQDGKITYDKKDGSGEGSYGYRYADLAAVTEAIGPLLGKHGLSYVCQVARDPADKRQLILTATLAHESGEERASEWYVGPADWAAQKLGGRITYGRRYMLGCLTGVVAEHDDDGADDRRSYEYQSAGAAFQQASRQRPDRNGGKRQQDDSGQTDKIAQAIANAVLRVGADPAKKPADLEGFEKQAAGKEKLDAPVANPFGDGLVKLRDVLRQVRARMEGRPPADDSADAEPGFDSPAASDLASGERDWMIDFAARVFEAPEDQLGVLQREIGQAVKNRKISTEVSAAAVSEIQRRRRELQDGGASEQAAAPAVDDSEVNAHG